MGNPSDAASKLLYGTGLGLFLVAGFGLIEGRMELNELGIGWIFVLIGTILIGLGNTLGNGSGPLTEAFPNESADELAMRVRGEIDDTIKDASVGSAWAELEANVLEEELSEQE
jgi:hypothetical protein